MIATSGKKSKQTSLSKSNRENAYPTISSYENICDNKRIS